jgi:hypothetical protein
MQITETKGVTPPLPSVPPKVERFLSLSSVLVGNAFMVYGIIFWNWDTSLLAVLAVLEFTLLFGIWALRMFCGKPSSAAFYVILFGILLGGVTFWPLYLPATRTMTLELLSEIVAGGWKNSWLPLLAVSIPYLRDGFSLLRNREQWKAHAEALGVSSLYYNLCMRVDWVFARYTVAFYAILATAIAISQEGKMEDILIAQFLGLYLVSKVVVDLFYTLRQGKQEKIFTQVYDWAEQYRKAVERVQE